MRADLARPGRRPRASRARRPAPCSAGRARCRPSATTRRSRATEPSTATPSAPPTWRDALTTPEAMPAVSGSTEPIATPVVVGIVIEMPAPTQTNDGKITVQYDASIESRVSDASPSDMTSMPADHQRPRPDAGRELAGERRDRASTMQRHRQRAHARLQRRVAAHVLEVEREEVDDPEHREADERDRRSTATSNERAAEERERDHRIRLARTPRRRSATSSTTAATEEAERLTPTTSCASSS